MSKTFPQLKADVADVADVAASLCVDVAYRRSIFGTKIVYWAAVLVDLIFGTHTETSSTSSTSARPGVSSSTSRVDITSTSRREMSLVPALGGQRDDDGLLFLTARLVDVCDAHQARLL